MNSLFDNFDSLVTWPNHAQVPPFVGVVKYGLGSDGAFLGYKLSVEFVGLGQPITHLLDHFY